MIDYSKHIISQDSKIIEAMERLNMVINQSLFVINNDHQLVGTLTDGDIRRGFIQGNSINDNVKAFMYEDFRYLNNGYSSIDLIKDIKASGVKLLPVLDNDHKILKVVDFDFKRTILPVDAIIMAGGRGERLKPLTDDSPKPLLKVGKKPIIEHVIDRLCEFGIENYYISVNYFGQKIVDFLGDGRRIDVVLNYIFETEPLGTIGSVSLIKDFKHHHLLLMNSDILTDLDFEDFYINFLKEDADIAIATIPYDLNLPYAVLGIKGNIVNSLVEKPTYTYFSNAGIYLMKKDLTKNIPLNKKYNATDLIQYSIDKGLKVINYPILGYWIDIGKHEDLKKAQEIFKYIKH